MKRAAAAIEEREEPPWIRLFPRSLTRLAMNRALVIASLITIVTFGATLRLFHLDNQSIWWDEALSLAVVETPLRQLSQHFVHDTEPENWQYGWNARFGQAFEASPPGYFIALSGWSELFGYSPLSARMMSVAAGVLTLVVLFALGVALFDEKTGLVATLLLAMSQLGIMYGQEARMYALMTLLFVTMLYLYVIAKSRRSLVLWCGCTTCGVLLVGTHYYGALGVLGLGVHAVVHRRRDPVPWTWLAGSALVGALALGPWMMYTLADQVAATVPGRTYRWSVVRWTTPISTLNKFNNGAMNGIVNTMPRWTFVAGAALFTAPALLMVRRWLGRGSAGAGASEREATSLCLATGLLPVVVVLGLGVAGVKYDVRYVVFCIAPYYLLGAAGVCRLRSPVWQLCVVVAAICYSGYALRAHYSIPYKEDFRAAASYVSAHAAANDCYAFVPFRSPPLGWMIYMHGPPGARVLTPDDASSYEECRRIWVVTYERGMEESPVPAPWVTWLTGLEATAARVEDRQFFWIRVELYAASGTTRAPMS